MSLILEEYQSWDLHNSNLRRQNKVTLRLHFPTRNQLLKVTWNNFFSIWVFFNLTYMIYCGSLGHSVHQGITPPPPLKNTTPLFLAKPPSKSVNCSSLPLFLGNLPLYIGFSWTPLPLKVGFFSGRAQNIKVFHL